MGGAVGRFIFGRVNRFTLMGNQCAASRANAKQAFKVEVAVAGLVDDVLVGG